MKYKLYQINLDEDTARYVFTGREEAEQFGLSFPPPRELYELVYEGVSDEFTPEGLFEELNIHHPADYHTRSLSISDVVVYDLGYGKELALFCDSFGFKPIRFTETETGAINSTFVPNDYHTYILLEDGPNRIQIPVEAFLGHLKQFKNQDGKMIKLSPEQIYAVLLCFYNESNKYRFNDQRKTMDEWTRSGMPSFEYYARVGDIVDEAIYENFLDILPPAAMSSGYLQVGEPIDHLKDDDGISKAVYMTFAMKDGEWRYLGNCFYRKTENRTKPRLFHKHYLELLD
mgnify:CR=1 FL=1